MKKNRIAHGWMLLTATACIAMMVACGKTEKEDSKAADEQPAVEETTSAAETTATDSIEAEMEAEADSEAEEQGSQVEQMASSWKTLPLTVYPAAEKADILDFAKTFCRQYNKYLPNVKILKYLGAPKQFNQSVENCFVTSDVPNGFFRMAMAYQYDQLTEMCYWKRPNGHSLVGVYVHEDFENGPSETAFMFYDYDPATKKMTPDMEVFGIVEKAVQEGNFDDYALRLPQKGKDIELSMYKLAGEDSYEPTERMLKWTGNSFNLVK